MIIKFEEMLRYDIFIFSLYNILLSLPIFYMVFFNKISNKMSKKLGYKEYVLLM